MIYRVSVVFGRSVMPNENFVAILNPSWFEYKCILWRGPTMTDV